MPVRGHRGHAIGSDVDVTRKAPPMLRRTLLRTWIPSAGAIASASIFRSPFQSPRSTAVAPAHAEPAGRVAQPAKPLAGRKELLESKTCTFALPSASPYTATT